MWNNPSWSRPPFDPANNDNNHWNLSRMITQQISQQISPSRQPHPNAIQGGILPATQAILPARNLVNICINPSNQSVNNNTSAASSTWNIGASTESWRRDETWRRQSDKRPRDRDERSNRHSTTRIKREESYSHIHRQHSESKYSHHKRSKSRSRERRHEGSLSPRKSRSVSVSKSHKSETERKLKMELVKSELNNSFESDKVGPNNDGKQVSIKSDGEEVKKSITEVVQNKKTLTEVKTEVQDDGFNMDDSGLDRVWQARLDAALLKDTGAAPDNQDYHSNTDSVGSSPRQQQSRTRPGRKAKQFVRLCPVLHRLNPSVTRKILKNKAYSSILVNQPIVRLERLTDDQIRFYSAQWPNYKMKRKKFKSKPVKPSKEFTENIFDKIGSNSPDRSLSPDWEMKLEKQIDAKRAKLEQLASLKTGKARKTVRSPKKIPKQLDFLGHSAKAPPSFKIKKKSETETKLSGRTNSYGHSASRFDRWTGYEGRNREGTDYKNIRIRGHDLSKSETNRFDEIDRRKRRFDDDYLSERYPKQQNVVTNPMVAERSKNRTSLLSDERKSQTKEIPYTRWSVSRPPERRTSLLGRKPDATDTYISPLERQQNLMKRREVKYKRPVQPDVKAPIYKNEKKPGIEESPKTTDSPKTVSAPLQTRNVGLLDVTPDSTKKVSNWLQTQPSPEELVETENSKQQQSLGGNSETTESAVIVDPMDFVERLSNEGNEEEHDDLDLAADYLMTTGDQDEQPESSPKPKQADSNTVTDLEKLKPLLTAAMELLQSRMTQKPSEEKPNDNEQTKSSPMDIDDNSDNEGNVSSKRKPLLQEKPQSQVGGSSDHRQPLLGMEPVNRRTGLLSTVPESNTPSNLEPNRPVSRPSLTGVSPGPSSGGTESRRSLLAIPNQHDTNPAKKTLLGRGPQAMENPQTMMNRPDTHPIYNKSFLTAAQPAPQPVPPPMIVRDADGIPLPVPPPKTNVDDNKESYGPKPVSPPEQQAIPFLGQSTNEDNQQASVQQQSNPIHSSRNPLLTHPQLTPTSTDRNFDGPVRKPLLKPPETSSNVAKQNLGTPAANNQPCGDRPLSRGMLGNSLFTNKSLLGCPQATKSVPNQQLSPWENVFENAPLDERTMENVQLTQSVQDKQFGPPPQPTSVTQDQQVHPRKTLLGKEQQPSEVTNQPFSRQTLLGNPQLTSTVADQQLRSHGRAPFENPQPTSADQQQFYPGRSLLGNPQPSTNVSEPMQVDPTRKFLENPVSSANIAHQQQVSHGRPLLENPQLPINIPDQQQFGSEQSMFENPPFAFVPPGSHERGFGPNRPALLNEPAGSMPQMAEPSSWQSLGPGVAEGPQRAPLLSAPQETMGMVETFNQFLQPQPVDNLAKRSQLAAVFDGQYTPFQLKSILSMLLNDRTSNLNNDLDRKLKAHQLIPVLEQLEVADRQQPGSIDASVMRPILEFVLDVAGLVPT